MCSLLHLVTKVLTNAARAGLFWVSLEGYSPSWQGRQWHAADGHTASPVRKKKDKYGCSDPVLLCPFFSNLGPQPIGCRCPHSEWAFPPQFNCSRNTPVDMPIHSSWHWRLTIRAVVTVVLRAACVPQREMLKSILVCPCCSEIGGFVTSIKPLFVSWRPGSPRAGSDWFIDSKGSGVCFPRWYLSSKETLNAISKPSGGGT